MPTIARRYVYALTALALAAVLTGCATNTKPKKPAATFPVVAPQTNPAPIPVSTLQRLDTKLNIQFDWWKLLHSPQLNTLIDQAFNAHPTVDAAQTTLLKTLQNDAALEGFFYSPVSVSDAADKPSLLVNSPNLVAGKFIRTSYFDLHTPQYTVGYLPELLRAREALTGSAATATELQRLQLEATYLTLSTNLIACVIQDAALRAQIVAVRKIAAIDQSLLSISRKRLKAGLVTQAHFVARQQAAEASQQALLALKTQFEQTRELLRFMLGLAPEAELPVPFDLAALHLSGELPLELSSALIQQRPDVRAALLEAHTNYQNALDTATRNVQDIEQAIYNTSVNLKAAASSEQESQAALAVLHRHYVGHSENYQDALVAEQNVQLAVLRLAQARALYLGNAVALYHALGGAWWNGAISLEIADELTSKHRPQ